MSIDAFFFCPAHVMAATLTPLHLGMAVGALWKATFPLAFQHHRMDAGHFV